MRRLFLGVLCIALAACGSDKTTGPDSNLSFAGTYSLRTINGSNLPYVFLQSGQTSAIMTDDAITIADGGTWSEQGTLRITTNGQTSNQVYSDNGTWLRSGNSLALYSNPYNNTAYSG
ncbi:MAG TPA: hypothetical protein VIR54_01465, partial [Vicinamibacterales bacterium]